MKHVVSFSGGRTSAYLVHLMEQKRINEGWDVEYVFMDTGAEHPKTYEFIRNVVKHFNIDLVCIKAVVTHQKGVGITYRKIGLDELRWDLQTWKDLMQKHGNPYVQGSFCTNHLKTIPHDKYCNENFGKGNYTTWLGIRIDEKRRLKGHKGVRYLAEISQMDKEDIKGWWRLQPFDLGIDEWLGNCVFCLKKGTNKVALALKQEPDLAKQWSDVTTGEHVRQKVDKSTGVMLERGAIYRGKLTIDGVAKMYEQFSSSFIKDNLRRSKRTDSGCGSESCEVFGEQMDMFGEIAA